MIKKIALTGDRPTGCLHLGHYIGTLKSRVELQNSYEQYVMVADIQALTDYYSNPKKIADSLLEVVADYISVGIDPNISTIFVQSQIKALPLLNVLFMNMVTTSRLERIPTVKNEILQKGFGDSIPVGFFGYPISQAADITAFKAQIIPVGDDQLPIIELCNEIVRRFNRIYNTNCLLEAEAYLSKTTRLVGIDGQAKASKSLGNAIFLSDTPEVVKEKVFSMYTDPDHIKVSDLGKVEGNVVFVYLDAFHENKEEVAELKVRYQKGGLGDVALKSLLNNTLQNLLEPIREKRASLKKDFLMDCISDGTKRANIVADKTLEEVVEAVGLNYFA
ncbi:MAG: tryptophan--tRNA ligase [Alphaproteobacteria bacterium]|nr:tryptophan--tRNA ligase [Alphaproteobacteria bacterium]